MKPSFYNFFYAINEMDQYIAYNSFSNALALLSGEEYATFQRLSLNQPTTVSEDLLEALRKGSFLVDDNVDELSLVRYRMNRARYFSYALGLTIAPTASCNFKCVYCYEKNNMQGGMMSKVAQDNLVKMVRSYAQYVKKLDITWYGGEPLLALDIIESLTAEFVKICDEFSLEYSASIITNGYLLTPDVAKRLTSCRIHSCQITLDGDRDTHNMQRPHKDGSGTFDVIIQNLKASSLLLTNIALRVNVSPSTPNAYTAVKKLVKEEGIVNAKVYSSPILDSNGCYSDGDIFTNESFYEEEYKELTESPDRQSILSKYPTLRFNACGADYINSFVVNFNGDLYKCWSDIGCEELCFGNIGSKHRKTDLEILYLKDDPTYDSQCSKCKFLPICIGGCPYKRRTNDPNRCIYFQNIFERYIRDIERLYRSDKLESKV